MSFVPHYLSGLVSGLVLIAAIGAQNAFVLRQGLRREHVLAVALVCIASDVLLIGIGIAGLGALLHRLPEAIATGRYAGAIFLTAYAGLAARRALIGQDALADTGASASLRVVLLSCLGFTFLNPHTYLDTVVLLGTLGNQHGEAGRWPFAAGAVTASLFWYFGLAYGARLLVPLFRRPLAWRLLDGSVAAVMLSLAYALVSSSRW